MFVALSKFKVANGMHDEVARAFRDRPHLVDNVEGFVRMDVISPCDDPAEFWLLTYWQTEKAYRQWHAGPAHKQSHQGIPSGLKLDRQSTLLRYFDHVTE